MEDWLIDIALALAVVAGAAFFLRHKLHQRQDDHAAFRNLAQQLGLGFHATHLGVREGPAGSEAPADLARLGDSAVGRAGVKLLSALPAATQFEIDGALGGLPVRIELRQRNKSQLLTAAQVRLPQTLGVGLAIHAQSALDRAVDSVDGALGRAAVGSAEVTLGRPDFDRQVRVRAHKADAARRLLADSDVQRATLALLKEQPSAWVDDQTVQVQLAGAVTDSTRWRAAFERMTALAHALDAAAKSPLR